MRDLLFRGQTRKKGEKVFMDGTPVDGNWVYGGVFQGKGDFSVIYTYDPVEKKAVYTDTVGQYAGIDDKNGTKVFEGDILKLKRHIYVIEWKGGCLYASQKNYLKDGASGYYKLIDSLMNEGAEIIGNIHDNPELLEEYAK